MYALTDDIAKQAIDLATPTILHMMDEKVVTRPYLHIIVALRDTSERPQLCDVKASQSFGTRAEWSNDYRAIAEGKLLITARTGLPSRQVQLMQPELLEHDDVIYWGSVIDGNIIVACSGVQPWFDEAISKIIAGICRALIQEDVEFKRTAIRDAGGITYDHE